MSHSWLNDTGLYPSGTFSLINFEEAIKGFDYLLAINSNSVGVYANKAACYEAMKQWDKALEVYEETLVLDYNKSFTFYKMGLCYREIDQKIQAFNPTFIRNQYINIISKIKYRFKGYLKAYNQQFKIINHHII